MSAKKDAMNALSAKTKLKESGNTVKRMENQACGIGSKEMATTTDVMRQVQERMLKRIRNRFSRLIRQKILQRVHRTGSTIFDFDTSRTMLNDIIKEELEKLK